MKKVFLLLLILLSTIVLNKLYATRFAVEVNNEYRFSNGYYVCITPSVYFGSKDFQLYTPAIGLSVGYSYAVIMNKSFPIINGNYKKINYHALYTGLSFINRFMINNKDAISLKIFGDVRLGGKFSIIDGGTTGCGICFDYKHYLSPDLGFGCMISGSYIFAGDFKGFDGGFGISFIWLL